MLKFKRLESGKYITETEKGVIEIWNSPDGKWNISFERKYPERVCLQ